MQVSWIEPDQLRDLVGRLQQPASPPVNGAWEVHTLPEGRGGLAEGPPVIADHDLWIPDLPSSEMPPEAPAEPAAFSAELPVAAPPVAEDFQEIADPPVTTEPEPAEPPPASELAGIREKLRAIRQKALDAGLLSRQTAPNEAKPSAPAVAVESPAAQPQHSEIASIPPAAAGLPSPFSIAGPALSPSDGCFTEVVKSAREERPEAPPAFTGGDPAMAADAAAQDPWSFEVPLGPIGGRVTAFAAWALRRLGMPADLLIIDGHGDILWGQHQQERLLVSATLAALASLRADALGAWAPGRAEEQPFGSSRLIILPARTHHGLICMAIIRPDPLADSEAAMLREALIATLDAGLDLVAASPAGGKALD